MSRTSLTQTLAQNQEIHSILKKLDRLKKDLEVMTPQELAIVVKQIDEWFGIIQVD